MQKMLRKIAVQDRAPPIGRCLSTFLEKSRSLTLQQRFSVPKPSIMQPSSPRHQTACAVEPHRMLTHIRTFRVVSECPEEHALHCASSRLELHLSIGLELPQTSRSFKSESALKLLALWSSSGNGFNQSVPHTPARSSTSASCQR